MSQMPQPGHRMTEKSLPTSTARRRNGRLLRSRRHERSRAAVSISQRRKPIRHCDVYARDCRTGGGPGLAPADTPVRDGSCIVVTERPNQSLSELKQTLICGRVELSSTPDGDRHGIGDAQQDQQASRAAVRVQPKCSFLPISDIMSTYRRHIATDESIAPPPRSCRRVRGVHENGYLAGVLGVVEGCVGPQSIMLRLRKLGVNLLGGRNSALQNLVAEVPPALVAELLGYSYQVTQRHAELASQPWARYAT